MSCFLLKVAQACGFCNYAVRSLSGGSAQGWLVPRDFLTIAVSVFTNGLLAGQSLDQTTSFPILFQFAPIITFPKVQNAHKSIKEQ